MAYDVNATFAGQQIRIEGTAPIDMYVVNASLSGWEPLYYANYNQDIYGFSMNATGNLTTAATLYTGLPITRDNVTTNTKGEIGELNLSIPNTDRVIESVIQNYSYLRGREVYTLTTFTLYLPSGGTAYHVGTTPDRNVVMKEKLFIDTTSSNKDVVTFTCKSKFNIRNITLPRRTFARECAWAFQDKYAATECDPNSVINTASFPTCDGTLTQCRARNNEKRYGGFPAIPRRAIVIF